ncbi:MAG: exodeoxyribonuclease VII large subunit, partial [Candidatus Competibacteraceae bacterium]|nr:exodeoxyribonuclease VII large subunit [Candidatus Competibacteraceae bacterium]
VSRLNGEVKALLERGFPLLWVEGEISTLSRPASGHFYFTLKDEGAQVRCALFRSRAALLRQPLVAGRRVQVRARVGLYQGRGDYQLIVESVEEAGQGALGLAFERLRERLAAEGLFDTALKRPLPRFPRRIGVITSPSGAAIRDVVSVLGRRFPALPVLVYPVPVQGEGAGEKIAQALELASQRAECDLLLLVRGGGSLEDLWAFNEERVARAIRACAIPVVAGVGHEVDMTIADFAADLRAPTPSAAAELVSPDAGEWRQAFAGVAQRLLATFDRELIRRREKLLNLEGRLERQHPGRRLLDHYQRLDELEQRLQQAMERRLERQSARVDSLEGRLQARSPALLIHSHRQRQRELTARLEAALGRQLERHSARLGQTVRALEAVSPLATLARGYAILQDQDGTVIRRPQQVVPGQRLDARLAGGRLRLRVDQT